jgi:hypothetical protein
LGKDKEYFELNIEELQNLGKWAAKCAEKSLLIFEKIEISDFRPRNAINGILEFSNTGKRTNALRKLALDAYRTSLETKNAAASAAAQSASLAAACAYTHPFKDKNQSKHILGSATYSALAIELYNNNDQDIGNIEIDWAIMNANNKIVMLLKKMPEQINGKKRIDQLFYDLDKGIRNKY